VIRFLAALGRGTTRWLARVGALARFAFEAITAASSLPRAGRRVAVRILLNQLRFTALEAVPLVVLLSGILSFLVISSSIGQLGRVGAVAEGLVIVVVGLGLMILFLRLTGAKT